MPRILRMFSNLKSSSGKISAGNITWFHRTQLKIDNTNCVITNFMFNIMFKLYLNIL